ncbi:helix-turn-helix domain-containing protein [Paenibacillus sp. LMG 31460]|uniref:Helix-turn-helix domain-containing protein n=1 Tax=Paenibacillus germinis TaxID=2654979 RepID=A0ABX1Z3S3_9BACL|nr:AraC family transcriptional regulator [Paenibacillus germinis]NOU86540.1 helix-turn-helix domain-containing protein [Paenibacillus germinis]
MIKNISLNKTWFRRLLFSYVTIFLFIVPLLMFILLMAFSELSRKTAVESNTIFTKQVLQSVDNQMKLIDNTITNEIASDDTLLGFFNPALRSDRYYSGYMSSVKVKSLMATMPLIDSIYLYRLSDDTVQTPYSVSKLAAFNDKQLIVEALKQSGLNHLWTDVRQGYTEQGEPTEFVSLVRYVPLNSGNDGLIVVNVQLQAIAHFVQTLTPENSNHLSLYDRKGTPIYGGSHGNDSLMTEMHSDYSEWAISSSVANGNLFRLVSAISKYWIFVCAIFFSIGVLWIVVVTRRNYKPVETIIQRIQLFSQQKSAELFRKGNQDEFKFIDTALVNLMEQSNAYQKQHEEDLIFKRKHFFFEWIEGNRPLKYEEWQQEMESLGMPCDFDSLCVSVLEINKYSKFASLYSDHDQNLLKFVLSNVVKEIASGLNVTIWTEWTSKDQLTLLHLVQKVSPESKPEQMASDIANDLMQWVKTNLDFNITMGIGSGVDRIELVHYAYVEALEALQYKPSLGEDSVICYWQIKPEGKQQSLDLLEYIREIAFSLRTGEGDWQGSFAQLFDGIRAGLYARKELDNLMSYMIFFLDKEFTDLPAEVQKIWSNGVQDKLQQAVDDWDTVDELQIMLRSVLTETTEAIATLREMSSNYMLIRKIKLYMEEHYQNPDLSLLHLSDVFHVHMKSISRTFKEEIGENFIDYLTRIRTEHAKELLVQTEHSIQEITVRIGYLHPNTFIRSFKKLVGQTPGDFRKTAQVKS